MFPAADVGFDGGRSQVLVRFDGRDVADRTIRFAGFLKYHIKVDADFVGAGGIVEIALDKPRKGVGKSLMLPFRESVVGDINLEQGTMVVDPTGWLEEER